MAVNYIYTTDKAQLPTPNDVTLLANAEGFTDGGRLVSRENWDYNYNRFAALTMTSDNARLTIGGVYENLPNISYTGDDIRATVAAVRFEKSGFVFFSAQTGAPTANQVGTSSEQKSDGDIVIVALSDTKRLQRAESWKGGPPITNNTTVYAFDAAGSLTVGGDVAGQFSAVATSELRGILVESGDKWVQTNTSVNQTNSSAVFKVDSLVVGNNFNGVMYAGSTATIQAWAKLELTGNVSQAVGIDSAGDVKAVNGLWSGAVSASSSGNLFTGLYEELYEAESSDGKPGKRDSATGNVKDNKITAIGLKAGGKVSIADMRESNGEFENFPQNIVGIIDDNVIRAQVKADDTADAVMNYSGNTFTAIGVSAKTLEIGSFGKDAFIGAQANNNSVRLESLGGKKETVNFQDNNMEVAGIKADSFKTDSFHGTVGANMNGNTVVTDGFSHYVYNGSSHYTVSGITVSGALNASGNFDGAIWVNCIDNGFLHEYGGSFSSTDDKYGYFEVFGIKAETFTVDGRFGSDIVLSVGNNLGKHTAIVGVDVKTLTADAFSGTITLDGSWGYGLHASDTLKSSAGGDDAFDINGSIYAANGVGILCNKTMNLRVSGTISGSSNAIMTEWYYTTSDNTIWDSGINNDDRVELAATAVINGDIDLGRGLNSIVINSNARMNGNLLATNGQMNIRFELDKKTAGVADGAIITADRNDISVTSPQTMTVDLNNAQNGISYILYQYDGDYRQYWANKRITFSYNGETKTIDLAKGNVCSFDEPQNRGVSATISYNAQTNQVEVTTSGVKGPAAFEFDGTYQFSDTQHTLALTWKAVKDVDTYEIEYRIDGGKSIVVKLAASRGTSYVIKGIEPGQKVEWRMRWNKGNGAVVSDWSNYNSLNALEPDLPPNLTMGGNEPYIVNPDNAGAGITSAVAKFAWGAAEGNYAIKNYTVQYFETENVITVTDAEKRQGITLESKIKAAFASGNYKIFTKTVTSTEAIVSGLTNQRFVYWQVAANDVEGNSSMPKVGESFRVWVGDDVKPYFVDLEDNKEKASVTATFNRRDPYNVTIDLDCNWSYADDSQSGVKQYVVEYKLKGADWNTATRHTVMHVDGQKNYSLAVNNIAGGLYEYRITAVDYVGNQSEPVKQGEFGSADLTPPEGKFLSFGTPVITVKKELISGGVTEEETDDGTAAVSVGTGLGTGSSGLLDDQVSGGGNSGGGSGGGGATPSTPVYKVTGATVTVSWEDTYTDPSGVNYIVEFSDDVNFSSNRKFSVHSSSKTLVLDDGVGNAVGQLSGMSTVYWRVKAVDAAGNESPFWGNGGQFTFADPDTGAPIIDDDTPTAPENLTFERGEGRNVTFTWNGSKDNFGLRYYKLLITKGTETRTFIGTNVKSSDAYYCTIELWADGAFTWKVVAVDGVGREVSSSTAKFEVDTAAPNWNGIGDGLKAIQAQNTPLLSWNKATDPGHGGEKDGGIKHYILQYRIAGQSEDMWQTLIVEGTERLLELGNGKYEFRVAAVDKENNQGEWSDTLEFTVSNGNDAGGINNPRLINSGWDNYGGDQTVGLSSDPSDCLMFRVDRAFELTISVSDVKSLYNNGSGITIKVLNSSGKVVGNYSVANGSKSFTMSLLAGMGQAFYIEVSSKKSNALMNYEMKVDYKELNANNADDTWTLAQNNAAYHCRVDAVSSEQGNKVSETLVETDWVGFGDTADYRKLVLSQAGNYSFTISNPGGANGGLANSVTLTIYKADGKSKLKSITVKPKYDARTGTWTATAGSTGYFLMEAGTYYVAVGAPGGNKGENTDYSVKVDGTVFNHAKNGIANNTIDQAKALAGVKLGGNADGTLTSTKVLEQEWVGYGDAVDYQKLVFQHAGSYTFTTSGLSGKVKLTVYSVDANGKQKSLKSITVNSGTGTIKDLLLEANTNYYIAVESTDAKKGASIDYEVSVGGKVFNHDKNGLANNSFDQARALPVLTVTGNADGTLGSTPVLADEWVGYGDAADWQKLTFTDAGSYTFTVSGLSQKAKLTVYSVDANGKLKSMKSITVNAPKSGVASGTIKDLLMLAGTTYYIAVEAPDWKKGVGTDYELNVSGKVFNHAKNNLANNSYDQVKGQSVTPITGNADGTLSTTPLLADEWVGYGDSVDFQKLTFTNAGSYTFTVSGVSQKVKLTVYSVDANGKLKSMKSITVNAPKSGVASGTIQNLLMEAGKDYYVAVEAPDWKKGVGTDYDLTVNGNVFNHAKNNLANNSYDQVKGQSVTPITGNADGTLSTTPLLADEWVGYGDSVDFQKLTFTNAGSYTFTVSGVSQKVKLTVYSVDANGKLKSMKSITVNAPKSGVASGTIQNLLMEAGKDYYVAVEAPDWKKGVGTDYDLTVNGNVFNHAKNNLANNSYEQVKGQSVTPITGSADGTLSSTPVLADEWVGYGDSVDFQKITLANDGTYSFTVSGVSQKVKLTVYGVDAKGNLKSLKSITVNAPKSGVASGTIQNLLMDAGSYYVAVEATDWKKGVGTDYNVSMSGSVYNNAKNGLNNGSWNAAGVETLTLSTGKAVSGEWVGYGDASDYFAFKVGADGSAAGQYTFKLTSADGNNLNGNATFTIYQKKYNSKGAASVSKVGSFTNNKADSITLDLGEGEYFMAVDSADKGKGKKNMGYDIDVTAPAAPSLTSFAQDQQPATAAAFADLAGFDGVTAALNAVAADTLAGFGSALDSLSGGDEQKKSPLFSVL